MVTISWCVNKKGGIEVIAPNANVARGYILKAEESLSMMQKAKSSRDWSISTAYYTMYFSLYAVLMHIGVKCEIHSCTIEFMKTFLQKQFTLNECAFMRDSLQVRIDAQYYIDREVKDAFIEEMLATAPTFLVKCKNIITTMKESEIQAVRKQVKNVK